MVVGNPIECAFDEIDIDFYTLLICNVRLLFRPGVESFTSWLRRLSPIPSTAY